MDKNSDGFPEPEEHELDALINGAEVFLLNAPPRLLQAAQDLIVYRREVERQMMLDHKLFPRRKDSGTSPLDQ